MSAETAIQRAIAALETERQQIDRKIAALQGLLGPGRGRSRANGAGRRRRRPMSAAARKAVSVRMKEYWAGRRKAKAPK
ncbi:MAG: hypothetical protein IT176_02185 [Acidobacteria bacterium]|nr:hypothetical protein [Acidobacteriota bacterium]